MGLGLGLGLGSGLGLGAMLGLRTSGPPVAVPSESAPPPRKCSRALGANVTGSPLRRRSGARAMRHVSTARDSGEQRTCTRYSR